MPWIYRFQPHSNHPGRLGSYAASQKGSCAAEDRIVKSIKPAHDAARLTTTKFRLGSVGPSLRRIQVWNRSVPCVDGSWLAIQNFTLRRQSVQPCVRPVSAVRMTAGHNALRGSGPGQQPAFNDALAHVGCPDRRIDRLCITCCSPSQPSHHAG